MKLALIIQLTPVVCLLAAAASATPRDPVAELAASPDWRRLLHDRGRGSEVEGPDFFLSPVGRADPEAELRADLLAFADPARRVGKLAQHPQCAFPVRYELVQARLGLKFPAAACPEYAAYLQRFNAHSVTLVFSSAYAGSPASMFGHTFLRVNARAPAGAEKIDLLDYGLSYEAIVPPKENSFLYAYLGVTGGYPGQFSMEPYYIKVREYNNGESRDLWEYDLSLSEAETIRLVSHVWEVEANGWFDYYFTTRNCAYQLMALLEAVRPDWSLTGHFLHVIPAETIKAVTAVPGAVTAVRFRPSLRKRMLAGYDTLRGDERESFDELRKHARDPAAADAAATLDAVITFLQYRKESSDGHLDEGDQRLLRQALLRRSQFAGAEGSGPAGPGSPSTEDTRPERGHFPYRLGVSGGALGRPGAGAGAVGFSELSFRTAYHDLMNDDRGYLRFSEIDFPGLRLRYRPEEKRLGVEELTLVSITSLSPLSLIEKHISWHAQTDYYAAKDFGCLDCHLLRGEGAVGATLDLLSRDAILYGLLYAYVEVGQSIPEGVRGGPKLELAALWNPVAPYKMRVSAMAVGDWFQSQRPRLRYQYEWDHSLSLGPAWELRASAIAYMHGVTSDYEEAKLAINRYF